MKIFKTFFLFVFVSLVIYPQNNITNKLGTAGVFYIKDATTNFFTVTQSTGEVNILKGLRLEATGNSSTTGVIFKGPDKFIHDFYPTGAIGGNTFIGLNSGNFTMSSGSGAEASYNTGVGNGSLSDLTTGHENTALGAGALGFNTAGFENTASGSLSLSSNTIGYRNTASGSWSLFSNTIGYENTASGSWSLFSNTIGYENTASGSWSLYSNTRGYRNTASGSWSLFSNIDGDANTATGYSSLLSNTIGNYNTALGDYAGANITSGSNNTAIGYDAQVPSATANNQMRIGNTNITYAGVQVAWTITSDKRWKTDIKTSELGLKFISKLNPVSYTRINDEKKRTEFGLIAQEVEKVLIESGIENSGMLTIDDEGNYALRYNDLLAPMIKAIQELKEENEKLKSQLEDVKGIKERLSEIRNLKEELNEQIALLKSYTQNEGVKISFVNNYEATK